MSSLVVRFSAFASICSRGWDEGSLCFLNLELAPSTTGGGGVMFSPIPKFSRRSPSMSLGYIINVPLFS